MARFNLDDCAAQKSPGRLVRRVAKLTTSYVEALFDEVDLSFAQWVALKVIRDGLVTNAGELSRELGITSGATTRLIDGLEERGLLERDRCCEDRRVVKVAVTETGREAVVRLGARVVDAWNLLVADLDQKEAEAFVATLTKMLATAERLTDGIRNTEAAE
jgi:DNA-binding MarR family transcriptional regulator